MRKISAILFLTLSFLFILVSCTGYETEENETVYKININNTQYSVDTVSMTVMDGLYTYNYSVDGDMITIYYPDGSSYWWKYITNGGHGGWSDDYDPEKYADGDILLSAIEYKSTDIKKDEKAEEKVYNPFGLVFASLGIFNILMPEKAWYFSYGWRYKNAQPSDEALTAERIGGGILIIMGILIFL